MHAQNHRCGMEPIETRDSDAKHDVEHAQRDGSCVRHIKNCYSVPEVSVLHGKTTGGVGDPQRLVILVLKALFCMHKTTGEGCNPYSLDTLVLSTLLCVLKTADEVWDPYRLISVVQKSLFACKNHRWDLGTTETCNSSPEVAVLLAQNHR